MNFRTVVQTMADTFLALAYSKQLGYHVRIDPDMRETIYGDDTRLQQILGNLISASLALLVTWSLGH